MIAYSPRPFTGRESELQLLRERLTRGGGVLVVRSAVGEGKTRLLQQVLASSDLAGANVLKANCDDSGAGTLFAVLDAIDQVCGSNASSSQLSETLQGAGDSIRKPGLPDPPLRLYRAVSSRLVELAARNRTILWLDDAENADLDTLGLVGFLAEHPITNLWIILSKVDGSSSAEAQAKMLEIDRLAEIFYLAGLDAEAAAALCDSICGPLRKSEKEYLFQVSGGNPLILTELSHHLLTTGALHGLSVSEAIERSSLPSSLESVLDLKLTSSLAAADVAILEAASCIGARFDSRLLVEVTGIDPAMVQDAIDHAQRGGLLKDSDPVEITEFEFVSSLIRDYLYRHIPNARRRDLHARLAEYGRSHPATFSTEQMAIHCWKGLTDTEPQVTFAACSLAAEKAEAVQAYDMASHFWSLALAAVALGDAERRATVLVRLGLARRSGRNWAQAVNALNRAHELFVRLGDNGAACEAAFFLGEMHRFQLDLAGAESWLRLALADLHETLRPSCLALLGGLLITRNEIEEGMRFLNQAMSFGSATSGIAPEVAFWAAFGLSAGGEVEEARELAEAGYAEARKAGGGQVVLLGGHLTFDALQRLDLARAQAYVADIQAVPQPLENSALVRGYLAQSIVAAYRGDWSVVASICQQWIGEVRLAGPYQMATAQLVLAEAYSALGELSKAVALAQEAIPQLKDMIPLASLHLARSHFRNGEVDDARALFAPVAARVAEDRHSPASLLFLADLAASLNEVEVCQQLFDNLMAEPRAMLVMYTPMSTKRVQAKVLSVLGDYKRSFSLFDAAIRELAEGGAEHELATTYHEYARARLARRKRGDALKADALHRESSRLLQRLSLPAFSWDEDEGAEQRSRFGLTRREIEVLSLVAGGLSNAEVGLRLSITSATAARHMESIGGKLGAANRTDAVMRAVREGIIQAGA